MLFVVFYFHFYYLYFFNLDFRQLLTGSVMAFVAKFNVLHLCTDIDILDRCFMSVSLQWVTHSFDFLYCTVQYIRYSAVVLETSRTILKFPVW
jgi:hypothetical protein